MAAADDGGGGGGADDGGLYMAMAHIPTVLVLCQRSRSSTDETVVDTVRGILNFIEDGLGVGPEFRIRFCTPCEIIEEDSRKKRKIVHCHDALHNYPGGDDDDDYADYNLELNSETLPLIQRKMQNERPPIRYFDYVILHTCPFFSMDFEAIWKIMGPDGKMIMTRVRDGVSEIAPVPKEVIFRPLADPQEVSSRIHMFFDDVDDKPGVYKKKNELVDVQPPIKRRMVMGMDLGNGGNKKGRKNTLRNKPKKSRSYRNRRYHRTRRSGSKKLK